MKCLVFTLFYFFSSQVKLKPSRWKNLILNMKSNLGLSFVVLSYPRTSPAKFTLLVVEVQQSPNAKRTDTKAEVSRLKDTEYVNRSKLCDFQVKVKNVVFCCRNILDFKDTENDRKMTERQKLIKRECVFDIFSNWWIVQAVTLLHIRNDFYRNWKFSKFWTFSGIFRDRNGHSKTIVFARIYFWVNVTVGTKESLRKADQNFYSVEMLYKVVRIKFLYLATLKCFRYMQLNYAAKAVLSRGVK